MINNTKNKPACQLQLYFYSKFQSLSTKLDRTTIYTLQYEKQTCLSFANLFYSKFQSLSTKLDHTTIYTLQYEKQTCLSFAIYFITNSKVCRLNSTTRRSIVRLNKPACQLQLYFYSKFQSLSTKLDHTTIYNLQYEKQTCLSFANLLCITNSKVCRLNSTAL